LQLAWLPWVLRGWLLPLVGICLAGWLRLIWPADSLPHLLLLAVAYLALLITGAYALGINFAFIRDELKIVRTFIGK
jgi:hypothetical protein